VSEAGHIDGAADPFSRIRSFRRPGPTPLYYSLALTVEEAVDAGELLHGSRLPAEKELAGELKVAITTVRSAWAYLEAKGLITRSTRGTFIR
jgi:DNA-binding GntR family transcriptional regulator